jgi:hypothetical protein
MSPFVSFVEVVLLVAFGTVHSCGHRGFLFCARAGEQQPWTTILLYPSDRRKQAMQEKKKLIRRVG